jgi:hypothetical protein
LSFVAKWKAGTYAIIAMKNTNLARQSGYRPFSNATSNRLAQLQQTADSTLIFSIQFFSRKNYVFFITSL